MVMFQLGRAGTGFATATRSAPSADLTSHLAPISGVSGAQRLVLLKAGCFKAVPKEYGSGASP
jgi:hypothetical protein